METQKRDITFEYIENFWIEEELIFDSRYSVSTINEANKLINNNDGINYTGVEIKKMAQFVIESIEGGRKNVLDIENNLKKIEDFISIIRKNERFKYELMIEASKYGNKTFDFKGSVITISNRATLDYSNDSKWVELKSELKQREELLKSIKEGSIVIDGATGEELKSPEKKNTEFLTIKY